MFCSRQIATEHSPTNTMIESIWYQMSAMAQDALLLTALLIWPLLIIGLIQWRYRVMSVVSGFLRNHSQASLAMVILIAIATAINILFSIQENAVRSGTARASNHFDLIVAAPGSQVDALLSTVFLQASALPLMSSEVLQSLDAHPLVDGAAPVALGDTIDGYPLVGTTHELIADLAGVNDATGFTETFQIIAGSETPAQPGNTLLPQHSLDIDECHGTRGCEIHRHPSIAVHWHSLGPCLHGPHRSRLAIARQPRKGSCTSNCREGHRHSGTLSIAPAVQLGQQHGLLSRRSTLSTLRRTGLGWSYDKGTDTGYPAIGGCRGTSGCVHSHALHGDAIFHTACTGRSNGFPILSGVGFCFATDIGRRSVGPDVGMVVRHRYIEVFDRLSTAACYLLAILYGADNNSNFLQCHCAARSRSSLDGVARSAV